ncbi:amino acid ABC transporter permease [Frateuria aurantia]|uniref:Amine acid ABC transporter, permease protein, 3-TM region, His/Glu/Gln/Arg/opine family n=1 Tax=Frateuria aurantia (strain ATCC 33424 / DSM 6220 / KCTC 2777 / LMG 1558 / NBRC 3245 / NCIMB 13370) TaxID=767434 RepID=H8KYG6_FRAAD|nr:amino acid ABC transporter permease [Frateuria aurantia]AFC86970.1 amine acid ABC transporter, permease protein, 3-TM region, His/Glu/Gln/Arg/opine family [Frateuria aurantia DSM 6220]
MTDLFAILHKYGLLLLMGSFPRGPLGGLAMTLLLSSLSLLLAFPFSVLLALARCSDRQGLYRAATGWVYVIRGIPLIMLIFWVYFLVPLLIGHNISGFVTMLLTLVVYESAYISEIIRAGMRALPKGQQEAASSLGLGYLQTQLLVILPQAIYNSVPSLVNQLVSIIKETSLGYVINVQELTFAANQINGQVLTRPLDIYLILALSYFLICFALTRLAGWLESRVRRRREQGRRDVTDAGMVGTSP